MELGELVRNRSRWSAGRLRLGAFVVCAVALALEPWVLALRRHNMSTTCAAAPGKGHAFPELGVIALACGFVTALLLGVPAFPARGCSRAARRRPVRVRRVRLRLLAWSFVERDFSVAATSRRIRNSQLPLFYRNRRGVGRRTKAPSLLWSLMPRRLDAWRCRRLAPATRRRSSRACSASWASISVGFLLFLLFDLQPVRAPAAGGAGRPRPESAAAGPGHGRSIRRCCTWATSASRSLSPSPSRRCSTGRLDARWVRWTRPWTNVAWGFLTLGIALGSWWAYYELGWGGWWFWDPVENASFMPWLAGTALIHSLAVTEKRGTFRSWTLLLAIAAFSLSLLGTFLVRSGVLTSVHAFAADPSRGIFILAFLALVIGGSLLLFAWRAPQVGAGRAASPPLSRESLLLANNVLLPSPRRSVLLGTLYPLLARCARPRQDLGRAALLRGRVRAADGAAAVPDGRRSAGALEAHAPSRAGARARAAALVAGRRRPAARCRLVAAGGARPVARGLGRRRASPSWLRAPARARRPPRRSGACCRAPRRRGLRRRGDPGERLRGRARTCAWRVGDTVRLAGYDFRLASIGEVRRPQLRRRSAPRSRCRAATAADARCSPRSACTRRSMPMTEAAIDMRLHARPLRLARRAARPSSDVGGARLSYKPFVDWIWGGCPLMALGGACATRPLLSREARGRVTPPLSASCPLALFARPAAFLGVGLTLDPRELPSPLVGKPAPAFELPRCSRPTSAVSARTARPGVDAQRLGLVVRRRAARSTPR